MKKRFLLTIVTLSLICALALFTLVGCKVDDNSNEPIEINVCVPDGSPAIALAKLLKDCSYYGEKAGVFKEFVLPGKTLKGAKAHILRTVTRRCERAYAIVYEKYGGSEIIFEYLNKLSTLFYHIARIYDEK